MVTRISCRSWSVLVCLAVLLAMVPAEPAECEQLYVARTTLMEALGPPVKGQSEYYKARLGNLCTLATSQRVLSNTAQTLWDLGLKYSPERILASAEVIPVKDTSIIAIEVTMPDPKDAKVAVDVFASELKKVYAGLNTTPGGAEKAALITIDPAYVRPYVPHGDARSPSSSASSPAGSLIIGLVVGLALGVLLAVLVGSRRRPSNSIPQQGA